jgi:2-oxoglutarate dehydrogenase E2 component (dihydrolipoamide succinyltransferase)
MPHLGESVDEGVITRWLIAEGDFIEEYEPLLEVNTDKVDTEIPSPASGVLLKILVSEGTTVQAGSVLAWIGEEHESPLDGEPESQISSTSTNTTTTPTTTHNVGTSKRMETPAPGRDQELGFISPIVARIASEHGIDLYQIIGTGKGGRITKRDVLAFLEADNKQVLDVDIASTPEPTPLRQDEVLH